MPPGSPRKAVQAGLGLLTEDRKQLGLLLQLSIRENASLAHLDEICALLGRRQRRRSATSSTTTSAGWKLRAGSWEQPVSSLSGGNQQKVLLARWLATHAKVLIFDEPTKGVDVGAKAEIYKVIGDLAAEGLGVIVVSSYLPEVLGLADRVLVMREGAVAGELPRRGGHRGGRPGLASPGDGAASAHRRERDTAYQEPNPAPRRPRPGRGGPASPRSASSRSATSSAATRAASSSCSSCSAP